MSYVSRGNYGSTNLVDQEKQMGFIRAHSLRNPFFAIPSALGILLNEVIDQFETGTITLIESNKISNIHAELHAVMVEATQLGWPIKLIDVANCFNPHLVSALTFNTSASAHHVLQNINLARPFQIHQSVSIIKQLVNEMDKQGKNQLPCLIIVTDISSQFFDESLASEDHTFPIPQLELFRHVIGVLQGLAVQGNMVILTDALIRKGMVSHDSGSSNQRFHATNLAYASNVHIRVEFLEDKRRVDLLKHPFLSPKSSIEALQNAKKKVDVLQTGLDDWY